jgi:hypothetical protein
VRRKYIDVKEKTKKENKARRIARRTNRCGAVDKRELAAPGRVVEEEEIGSRMADIESK